MADFNTLLSIVYIKKRQKCTVDNIVDKMGINKFDLIDIYEMLLSTMTVYMFFETLKEYLPKWTIFWVIKQTRTHFKKLKSFRISNP